MSEDQVGYGRPPKATRFQPGKSGNPKGRPKEAKNFRTEIEAELNSKVEVAENGERRKVSKRKVIVKRVVNKAVQGDPKSIDLLMQHERMAERMVPTSPDIIPRPTEKDLPVMASVIKRIRQMDPVPEEGELS